MRQPLLIYNSKNVALDESTDAAFEPPDDQGKSIPSVVMSALVVITSDVSDISI